MNASADSKTSALEGGDSSLSSLNMEIYRETGEPSVNLCHDDDCKIYEFSLPECGL